MAKEIERKFLVNGSSWKDSASSQYIVQAYLNSAKERCVRLRITGDLAFITIKGLTRGVERVEFEYEIPIEDARKILSLCEQPIIEKTRYRLDAGGGLTWEIDEFHGVNEGLVVAEIELPDPETHFERPNWLGKEVSDDPKYFNSNLIAKPFSQWDSR